MTSISPSARDLVVIDDAANRFRVARRAFVSEEVLKIEQREIFDKCWLYFGHDSEVPDPGRFVARSVAGRHLLFVRDRAGAVQVFYNSCPHRGARVCKEERGKAKVFQCFYHGWVFDLDGTFRRQPDHAAYAEDFNSDGCANLVSVPRLESYRGFWFVNFDRGAISLHDYLAGAREFIDCIVDQSETTLEVISGAQEYGIRANWKLLCENSIDGFHADSTHASYFDYVRNIAPAAGKLSLVGTGRDLGNGHAIVEYDAPWGRPCAKWSPAWGEETKAEVEGILERLEGRVGAERAHRIAKRNRNLLIFPNLVIVDGVAIVLRTMSPDGPGRMNVSTWAVAPQEESPWARKIRLNNFLEFLGPAGLATPDDIEALEQCQRGYENVDGAMWNELSKGDIVADELPMEDETQIRAFWRQWITHIEAAPHLRAAAE